ncbi:Organelle RRM domain-containing protein 2, mitochondrial [Vitis vinifera]|uniref:Organelle RRM domain-containing protein 2, mitochondrial n=1 Tax=Vitis vinifera TaxID=29760 RepID=A0A438DW08_VITVI|nr:Organelle RRM domain-containing protein 2, mitochondrial [Vitis vinifera]
MRESRLEDLPCQARKDVRKEMYQVNTSPGLSRLTTDEKLKEAFSPFGQLLEAKVITDRVSGRSKGFGFVTYTTLEEAEKAREGMNAKFLDGWVILLILLNQGSLDLHLNKSRSLLKLVSEQTRQLDGVGDFIYLRYTTHWQTCTIG